MADNQQNQKPASFIITLEDYIEEQQKDPAVADRLGSGEMQALLGSIAAGFGVPAASFSYAAEFAVMKKDWAVYLPEILEQNLNLDHIVARAIAAETAAKIFPKFGARFDTPKKYEDLWKNRKLSPIPLSEAINSILSKVNAGSSGPKISEILATRFNEVRDERGMLKTLIAKKENGGAGIKEKDAEIIVRLAAMYSGNIVRPRGGEALPPANGGLKPKTAVPQVPKPAPVQSAVKKEITIGASDAQEARQISETKAINIAPAKTGEEFFKEKIRQIVAAANLNFSDPFLAKRFETILSARFRDVRDEMETKEMLMRGEKIGGLGLSAAQTEKVLDLLKGVFAEVSVIYKKEEEEKKNRFVRETVEREALRRADRERREREEREKLYARVTGIAPTIKTIKKPTVESQSPPSRIPSAGRQGAGSQQPGGTPAVQPQAPVAKPRIEEVKFAPKVAGPVEELRQMGVAEFHRLSKDPKMAVQKIKDKLELLADEDYSKKISGIKAWQESGVNRLYLNILRDSLVRGMPIAAAIDEAAKAGGDIITKDEFTAIMELNRDLRF